MERTAECHCGSLRAIVSGDPEWVDLCHCKACRRTGTAFHFGATYLKDRVRLEGERKIYQRDGDSGYPIRFHFCPKCGSNVYWEGDSNTVYVESLWAALPIPISHCRPIPNGRPRSTTGSEFSIVTEHYPQGRPPRT